MTRENKIGTYFDITEILDTIPFVFFKDIHGKYQGANLNQARSFGFYHPSDFIGKTIFEIIDDSQTAQRINHADNEVMQKDIKLITEETLETTEGKRIFLSQRQPVHDERGQVVGMMGFAMDITDIKNSQHQLEAQNEKLIQEKHGLEVEYYKNIADQQIQFHRIAKQIAHDIVSPLSALNTIISRLENIPENHRSTLKMAATRIGDITNDLLNQFRPTEQEDARSTAEQEVIFASLALKNIMSEKRIENHTQTVQFDHDIEPQACFAFIRTNRKSFQRILSNVFNNALDAMQGMKGIILATMRITDDHVFIEIADEGKGLSVEVREKIMNGIAVTDLRHNGHGTDLGQVRDS